MKFQFQIDGRGFGAPIRDKWEDAAQDAVSDGYAVWVGPNEIRLAESAEIARIPYVTD